MPGAPGLQPLRNCGAQGLPTKSPRFLLPAPDAQVAGTTKTLRLRHRKVAANLGSDPDGSVLCPVPAFQCIQEAALLLLNQSTDPSGPLLSLAATFLCKNLGLFVCKAWTPQFLKGCSPFPLDKAEGKNLDAQDWQTNHRCR